MTTLKKLRREMDIIVSEVNIFIVRFPQLLLIPLYCLEFEGVLITGIHGARYQRSGNSYLHRCRTGV